MEAHLRDEFCRREKRLGEALSKELDNRRQHPGRKNTAGHHNRGDSGTDDVADTEQFRRNFGRNLRAFEPGNRLCGNVIPQFQPDIEDFVTEAEKETGENSFCAGSALFADDQDFGASCSFRVNEFFMSFDDERITKRNHHEDAEEASQHGDQHDPAEFHVVSQDQEGRHRDRDAERD